tara:strand:+ start:9132 stop:9509 length:378 start_codon:yes stop_codon:yes gene_type:complete
MKVFILTDNDNLARVKGGLYETIKSLDLAKPKRITIEDDKESKTGEQRSWFHILCGMFGAEIGYTKLQMKRLMLAEVYGTEIVLGKEISKSSESLSRKSYSQLIEQTYIKAGEMGVQLPPPRMKG